jgi:hypothetical protein
VPSQLTLVGRVSRCWVFVGKLSEGREFVDQPVEIPSIDENATHAGSVAALPFR